MVNWIRCSAVELFGGPCDGERRVVPDTENMLKVYGPPRLDVTDEGAMVQPLVYTYVRSPDEFGIFVLVPEVLR